MFWTKNGSYPLDWATNAFKWACQPLRTCWAFWTAPDDARYSYVSSDNFVLVKNPETRLFRLYPIVSIVNGRMWLPIDKERQVIRDLLLSDMFALTLCDWDGWRPVFFSSPIIERNLPPCFTYWNSTHTAELGQSRQDSSSWDDVPASQNSVPRRIRKFLSLLSKWKPVREPTWLGSCNLAKVNWFNTELLSHVIPAIVLYSDREGKRGIAKESDCYKINVAKQISSFLDWKSESCVQYALGRRRDESMAETRWFTYRPVKHLPVLPKL